MKAWFSARVLTYTVLCVILHWTETPNYASGDFKKYSDIEWNVFVFSTCSYKEHIWGGLVSAKEKEVPPHLLPAARSRACELHSCGCGYVRSPVDQKTSCLGQSSGRFVSYKSQTCVANVHHDLSFRGVLNFVLSTSLLILKYPRSHANVWFWQLWWYGDDLVHLENVEKYCFSDSTSPASLRIKMYYLHAKNGAGSAENGLREIQKALSSNSHWWWF